MPSSAFARKFACSAPTSSCSFEPTNVCITRHFLVSQSEPRDGKEQQARAAPATLALSQCPPAALPALSPIPHAPLCQPGERVALRRLDLGRTSSAIRAASSFPCTDACQQRNPSIEPWKTERPGWTVRKCESGTPRPSRSPAPLRGHPPSTFPAPLTEQGNDNTRRAELQAGAHLLHGAPRLLLQLLRQVLDLRLALLLGERGQLLR